MLVTYHVNTFNKLHLFRNLIRSFAECNMNYKEFEWVIFDYGSTDGTRDCISDFARNYGNITAVFKDESDYFSLLARMGLPPSDFKQKKHAIFGRYRNEARALANGELFVDIADDHQFIRPGDWIDEMLSVHVHRKIVTGRDDISSVLYRGLSTARILKANNARFDKQTSDMGVEYYVCREKRYDDYHLMARNTYRTVGRYLDIDHLDDAHTIQKWLAGHYDVNHYEDYLSRAHAHGMYKAFLKYPYVIDFPNYLHASLNHEHDGLIVPLLDLDRIRNAYGDLDRPVSTDELLALAETPNKEDGR